MLEVITGRLGEGEKKEQELTAEDLRTIFTSPDFLGRILTLYEQADEWKGVPWKEQAFAAFRPVEGEVYITPLTQENPWIKPPPHLRFLESIKSFLGAIKDRRKIPKSTRLAVVAHTHPPWLVSPRFTGKDWMIIPSAITEKQDKGDLYALLYLRRETKHVLRRPIIMVILQRMRQGIPIEFLLVQETEKLRNAPIEKVIEKLKEAQNVLFPQCQTQEEVLETLNSLGYQAIHIALPEERFALPYPFSEEDLEKIAQFAY